MTDAPALIIATSLPEALAALAAGGRPIAGGTDLVVGARQGKAPLPPSLVAIDRIAELDTVAAAADRVRIGATVTFATLMTDSVVVEELTALADAAALVGSPATRNVGTLGGNVMNASPAMDTGAPLAVFDAMVELQSADGGRQLPVGELWTGPGQTSAAPDELCTAVTIPRLAERSGSAYVRLEYRRAMEIAVVGAAAMVTLAGDGTVARIALALAAVAPTIVTVEGLDAVVGRPANPATLTEVAERARDRAAPISDLRAGEAYRRHCVGVMASRAVDAAARRAVGEPIAVPVNRALGIGAAS